MLTELLEKLGRGESLSVIEQSHLRDEVRALDEVKTLVKGWVLPGTNTPIFQPPLELFFSKILEENKASQTIEIPNKYTHLIVTGIGRTTATPGTGQGQSLNFTFNDDTGTNYQWSYVFGRDTGAGGDAANSQSNLPFGMFATDDTPAAGASAFYTVIPHYRGGFWKMCLSIIAQHNETTTGLSQTAVMTGFWTSANPITSMTIVPGGGLGGSLKAGSLIAAYGMQ